MILRRGRAVMFGSIAIAALVSGCDPSSQDAAETTPSTSSTTSTTTTEAHPAEGQSVPYTDSLYGFRTVVPVGWAEDLDGVTVGTLLPEDATDDGTLLAMQFLNGAPMSMVSTQLQAQLSPSDPLEADGVLEGLHYSWDLLRTQSTAEVFGGNPTAVSVAFSAADGGIYMVLLAAPPEEMDELRASVFVPAVEALAPPDRPDIPADAAYLDPAVPIEDRIEDLLSRMTLLEKIGQMTLVDKDSLVAEDLAALGIGGLLSGGGGAPSPNTPEAWADMVDGFQEHALTSRLQIPLLYGSDAVHGHNNVKGAVVFPHNIGLGATRDAELVEAIGRATAIEAAATGVYWNFAPVVAVPQDIRWGRTYEGYGEESGLVSDLGTAFLRGLQGSDLADRATMLATPKHFVADGGTAWGSSPAEGYSIDQGVARIDEETLREVHLPPYQSAVDAGALSVMASFSSWGGTKMHANRYLLTDVLKGELGFEGFVVSDWAGIDQVSDDYRQAVITSVNAGIDMNMVPSRYRGFIWVLAHAVENGDVSIDRIDDAVRRILRAKYALGLFESPFANRSLLDQVGSDEHRTLARGAVRRSLVLLENVDDALPISPDVDEIFVAGQAADNIGIQSGGWTIEWQGAEGAITPGVTIFEGIAATAPGGTAVYYDRFGRLDRVDPTSASLDPDICVAVVGERPYAEGVGDAFEPRIENRDLAVLSNLEEPCDRIVVVLISGRPLLIADLIDGWDAVVAAWLPGSEGDGVADVLFGLEPFSGRLSVSWPSSVEQLPTGSGEPMYPYGFGLTTAVAESAGG